MKRLIKINELEIEYNLIRKNVKNINLRINSAGEITVSANKNVSISYIEKLLLSKADFVLNALNKIEEKTKFLLKKDFQWKILLNLLTNTVNWYIHTTKI